MNFIKKLKRKRAEWYAGKIHPYLKEGDRVLDFGCGDMSIALSLSKKLSLNIVGTDVVDYRWPEAKHFTYTSLQDVRLPFADGEFDVVLASFVLHHVKKDGQEEVLRELARVSKKGVVILEDVYTQSWERMFLCVNDCIGNKLESFLVPLPYSFRKASEWRSLIKAVIKPRSIEESYFRALYGLWKAPHVLFAIYK